MKLSRKLVPAIAMLLVSAVMLSTASFAWFSMNTKVDATNITIQAQAMGSLVISTSAPTDALDANTAALSAPAAGLYTLTDVMRDATATSGLKTIPADFRKFVDSQTGAYDETAAAAAVDGDDPIYTSIANTESGYFYDYVVYIAARADDINGDNTLTATFDTQSTAYYAGVAVDVYVEKVAEATADGTVPTEPTAVLDYKTYEVPGLTGTKAPQALLTTSKNSVVIYKGDIPVAPVASGSDTQYKSDAIEGYLKVTMRVYIDGSQNAVNNKTWVSDALAFGVQFSIS